METHLEYLTSSLKSALENNEILIAQITALKNENQKIGKILQVYWAQNQNIADKQRKYKEEIARVNVTVD